MKNDNERQDQDECLMDASICLAPLMDVNDPSQYEV